MFDIDYLDTDDSITLSDLPDTILPENDDIIINTPEPGTTVFGPINILEWDIQALPDNCAVEAERALINAFIDTPLSQEEAAYISATNGWYRPGTGTSPSDIGQLLDMYNIPNHSVHGADIQDIARELAQGHGIIVGVDSLELWDKGLLAELKQWISETFGIDFGSHTANHAVIVTGMDISDPSNPMVIINDSGVTDGESHPYPMDKFIRAWEDSDCFYTATNNPLPAQNIVGGNLFDLSQVIGGCAGLGAGIAEFCVTMDPISAVATGTLVSKTVDELIERTGVEDILEDVFKDDTFITQL